MKTYVPIKASDVGTGFTLEATPETLALHRAAILDVLGIFPGSVVLGVRDLRKPVVPVPVRREAPKLTMEQIALFCGPDQ